MSDTVKKVLSSGVELEITPAPWEDAKALYKAIAAELIPLKIQSDQEIDINLFKDIFLTVLASDKVEAGLWVCFKRATYAGLKIEKTTFEPMAARGDYLEVCMEVAVVNVHPFMKSLFAKYFPKLQGIIKSLG